MGGARRRLCRTCPWVYTIYQTRPWLRNSKISSGPRANIKVQASTWANKSYFPNSPTGATVEPKNSLAPPLLLPPLPGSPSSLLLLCPVLPHPVGPSRVASSSSSLPPPSHRALPSSSFVGLQLPPRPFLTSPHPFLASLILLYSVHLSAPSLPVPLPLSTRRPLPRMGVAASRASKLAPLAARRTTTNKATTTAMATTTTRAMTTTTTKTTATTSAMAVMRGEGRKEHQQGCGGEGEGGQREKGIGGEEEDEEVMVRISVRMAFTFSDAMKHEVPLAPR